MWIDLLCVSHRLFHDSIECVKYQRNHNLLCRYKRFGCLIVCVSCYKGHYHCAERSCYECHKFWIPSCSHLQMGFPKGDYCILKSSILIVKISILLNHSFQPGLFVWRVKINLFPCFLLVHMSESNCFILLFSNMIVNCYKRLYGKLYKVLSK